MQLPSAPPPRRSLFLVGYRGSGKSSTGRLLARRVGCVFEDTDRLVENAAGKSIARCFAEDGEAAFRALEADALATVCARILTGETLVVATGGGIILSPANVSRMRQAGLVVWLAASAGTLAGRIEADPGSREARPALAGKSSVDEVVDVLGAREPLYRAAADVELSVEGLTPEEVVDRWLAQDPWH